MEFTSYSKCHASKMITVVNQFKKALPSRIRDQIIAERDERQFTLFPELPIELRLKIWAFCYLLPQPPRIVEVRTQEHDNCPNHEGFCPRYSPTRKHPLVNTCHEARAVARSEALKAGRLIFSFPSSPEFIIFNPVCDLLYLPNEPLTLTRGPLGTYTQYKKSALAAAPPPLRRLAIGLERYGNQFNPMRCAIRDFPGLEDLILVAPDRERAKQVRGLEQNVMVMRAAWLRRRHLDGLNALSAAEFEERRRAGEVWWERSWPRVSVAVKCEGGRLEILEGS